MGLWAARSLVHTKGACQEMSRQERLVRDWVIGDQRRHQNIEPVPVSLQTSPTVPIFNGLQASPGYAGQPRLCRPAQAMQAGPGEPRRSRPIPAGLGMQRWAISLYKGMHFLRIYGFYSSVSFFYSSVSLIASILYRIWRWTATPGITQVAPLFHTGQSLPSPYYLQSYRINSPLSRTTPNHSISARSTTPCRRLPRDIPIDVPHSVASIRHTHTPSLFRLSNLIQLLLLGTLICHHVDEPL